MITQNDVYLKINDVTNVPVCTRMNYEFINFFLQATLSTYLELASKIWCHLISTLQRYDIIFAHVPKRAWHFASEKLQYTGMAFI